MTKRKTASAVIVIGLGCFASVDAPAQVSKVRTTDGAVLSTTAPKASTAIPDANPAAEEALPDGVTLIYTNLGTGTSVYNAGTGWTEAGAEANDYPLAEAMAFTLGSDPPNDYILVRIDMGITYLQGTNGMNLILAEDNGGVPGTIIYSTSFTNLPDFGTCCTLQTAKLAPTKSSYVALKAGQQYWLYPLPADTTTYLIWNLDVTKKQGNGAVSKDYGTTWTAATMNPFGAFNLYGYPVK
ncbi:MAG TPA: choice-of-anchor R domain-containing protein [Bryobacteraceae bacterium]|jgi:hypothetical protein|nr:choice-of-anchor R domain-containing protein [Bryobacteraceae bacterium]